MLGDDDDDDDAAGEVVAKWAAVDEMVDGAEDAVADVDRGALIFAGSSVEADFTPEFVVAVDAAAIDAVDDVVVVVVIVEVFDDFDVAVVVIITE